MGDLDFLISKSKAVEKECCFISGNYDTTGYRKFYVYQNRKEKVVELTLLDKWGQMTSKKVKLSYEQFADMFF